AGANGESNRVLVVDDEPDLRDLLSHGLSRLGLSVDTAANGQEAFELIEKNRYRFVFTDIDMPKMGGIELVSLIKVKHPTLPVAICSSRAAEYARLLLKLVSPASLLKPFSFAEVESCAEYLTELGRKYRAVLQDKKISTIGEIMVSKIFTVEPGASVKVAVDGMIERRIGAVLVVQDEKLVGIFTERDLLYQGATKGGALYACRVEDVMTKNPYSVHSTMTVDAAMELMDSRRFRHLPIVEGGKLVGIVSIRDLSRRKVAELSEVAEVQTERLKELQEVLNSKLRLAPKAA
ncbi:MAG: CBS domain-containing protein, partial [Bdellovibrionota bacterium]